LSSKPSAFTYSYKVAEQLQKIMKEDPNILNEPARFQGLLRDIYVGRPNPTSRREINVIVTSLKARITDYLLAPGQNNNTGNYTSIIVNNMANKLSDEYGIDTTVGQWAVRCWAGCLGVISISELKNLDSYDTRKSEIDQIAPAQYKVGTSQDSQKNVDATFSKQSNISKLAHEADVLFHRGLYKEAIKLYDKILSMDDKDLQGLKGKGLALTKLGKYTEAIECCDRALVLQPHNVDVLKLKEDLIEIVDPHISNITRFMKKTFDYEII